MFFQIIKWKFVGISASLQMLAPNTTNCKKNMRLLVSEDAVRFGKTKLFNSVHLIPL